MRICLEASLVFNPHFSPDLGEGVNYHLPVELHKARVMNVVLSEGVSIISDHYV